MGYLRAEEMMKHLLYTLLVACMLSFHIRCYRIADSVERTLELYDEIKDEILAAEKEREDRKTTNLAKNFIERFKKN